MLYIDTNFLLTTIINFRHTNHTLYHVMSFNHLLKKINTRAKSGNECVMNFNFSRSWYDSPYK